MQLEGDLVDAGVERDHGGQRDPEVADLEDAVEQRVLHVLDVALADRHRPVIDEILPADNGREEHEHRYGPGHHNGMVPRWRLFGDFFVSCIFSQPLAARFRPAF